MSRSRRSNPKYRHYQPKDLDIVRIDGKDHYLRRYDSPESWEKYHRLVAEWLSRGQTIGTDPVTSARPSDSQYVDAVQPFVTPHVAAMIQVQRLTGRRPDDVVCMRPCDIDPSGDVWIYERRDHKNRWRGHRRLIPLGAITWSTSRKKFASIDSTCGKAGSSSWHRTRRQAGGIAVVPEQNRCGVAETEPDADRAGDAADRGQRQHDCGACVV